MIKMLRSRSRSLWVCLGGSVAVCIALLNEQSSEAWRWETLIGISSLVGGNSFSLLKTAFWFFWCVFWELHDHVAFIFSPWVQAVVTLTHSARQSSVYCWYEMFSLGPFVKGVRKCVKCVALTLRSWTLCIYTVKATLGNLEETLSQNFKKLKTK